MCGEPLTGHWGLLCERCSSSRPAQHFFSRCLMDGLLNSAYIKPKPPHIHFQPCWKAFQCVCLCISQRTSKAFAKGKKKFLCLHLSNITLVICIIFEQCLVFHEFWSAFSVDWGKAVFDSSHLEALYMLW